MSVTCPVVICPSMNTHMFESKAVQRNLEILRSDGYFIISPESGSLACGTTGPGRLPEPCDILDRTVFYLTSKDLVITSYSIHYTKLYDAAIANNSHPAKWTYGNINAMRSQLKRLGFSYDWDRET